MNNFFNNITGAFKKSLRFLFFTFIFLQTANAQTITNLDRFYSAVDSASTLLLNDLGNTKEVKLDLNLGTYYSVFGNQVRGKLLKNGVKILNNESSDANIVKVNFVLDECIVDYSQPERDGLFGDYFTERSINVSGNYFISSKQKVRDFNIAQKDKIAVEDVEKVENRSYPFTHGELPPEPFFSSLLEPIVAVGAAAITVILFFSVRSK
jgi:hypothetical protein